jgi:DNA repair photolyase
MKTPTLWGDAADATPQFPVVGTQSDIRYYGTSAKGVLNSPASTGMGFWSINPYVGCAFGCAYCYARYAHRYVLERAAATSEADCSPSANSSPRILPMQAAAGWPAADTRAATTPGEGEVVPPPASMLAPSSAALLADDLAELPSWLAFERRIFVKRNAADVLRRTLFQRDSLGAVTRGEAIAIGTATDPYQPAERLFRVTRGVLEVLAEAKGLRVGITTKSPLITRDIDLLRRIASRSKLWVHLSLITLDRDLARRIEPRAPTPEARLRALKRLRDAGIDTGINVMPVLPGLTDRPADLAALVRRVAEAGATHINCCALRLRVTARRRYLPFLAQEFPHLADRYRSAYAGDHQIGLNYREGLRQFMKRACRAARIRYGMPDENAAVLRAVEAWELEAPEDGASRLGDVRHEGRLADARHTGARQQEEERGVSTGRDAVGDSDAAHVPPLRLLAPAPLTPAWRLPEGHDEFWSSVRGIKQLELL